MRKTKPKAKPKSKPNKKAAPPQRKPRPQPAPARETKDIKRGEVETTKPQPTTTSYPGAKG